MQGTPAPAVYLPLAHAAHWLPAPSSKPALQWHSDAASAPTSDVRPPVQMSHACGPAAALNEPAGQARQASGRPEKPALHWQVVVPEIKAALRRHGKMHAELPAVEVWLAGQVRQAAMALPLATLYLPAAHAEHALATTGSEKPALHSQLTVFGVKALAGGLAHATLAPKVYLPLAHAAHRLPVCIYVCRSLASKPALHPWIGSCSHADSAMLPSGDIGAK